MLFLLVEYVGDRGLDSSHWDGLVGEIDGEGRRRSAVGVQCFSPDGSHRKGLARPDALTTRTVVKREVGLHLGGLVQKTHRIGAVPRLVDC